MADPFFSKTVIYLMAHSEQGAMGVIINRPAGKASLQKLLAALGIKSRVKTRVEVFLGGPVELGKGLILHSPDYSAASTQIVAAGLAVSTGVDVLQDLANGKGPRQSRLVVGYAGWSAGQLEREIAHGDWLSAPVDPALVFSAPDEMWSKALLHAGIRL
jgi:putative transcriptional regulator